MTAVKSIIASLETFFAEQDAKIADADVAWAMGRVAAIEEFQANTKRVAGDAWTYYPKLHAIAGGKTWYNMFYGRNAAMIEEMMRKGAKSTADKRNFKIAKKLTDKGVDEVKSAEVGYCPDGFRGTFIINGDRKVTIEAILAGGYNIQRLHQRILVNVK